MNEILITLLCICVVIAVIVFGCGCQYLSQFGWGFPCVAVISLIFAIIIPNFL
jgi:hypothetical protein